jgi:hypothetical protein
MKFTISTLLLLVALLLGGCKDWFPPIDPNDPTDPNNHPDTLELNDSNDIFLTRHTWCLIAIESGGSMEMVDPALHRYVIFDGGTPASNSSQDPKSISGKVHGSGGINSFSANFAGNIGMPFSIPGEGGLLELEEWITTKVRSDPTETTFFNILSGAKQYVGDDNGLMILDYPGNVLHFVPCDNDSVRIDDPVTADLDKDFRLRFGQFAQLDDNGQSVRVSFDGLLPDSRCPIGVQCSWEGDAGIVASLMLGNTSYSGELHTNASVGPQVITLNGYDVKLVELTPYPVANQTINPDGYVAVLHVTKH